MLQKIMGNMESSMGITELCKFVAPETIFGAGARRVAGQYARKFGITRPLVVTDPGVLTAGWAGDVLEDLKECGIDGVLFSDLTPNPKAEEVMAGVSLYCEQDCDGIVAVGGGSPMDCAKGIGVVVSNGGHVLDYEGVDKIVVPMPPLICIPTTAGSSADVSQFSIINDCTRRTKIAIISKTIIPDLALIDPETLVSMSAYETACTGMDALVHAIEAYVSNAHSPITDLHALEAIRTLADGLLPVLEDPENIELRARTMLGSMLAGLAFSNASLGAVHALAHSLGGYRELPHGECNAMLLRHVVAFNFAAVPERYQAVAMAMGLQPTQQTPDEILNWLLTRIDALRISAGITNTLNSCGITAEDIPLLAETASLDPCLVTNPRQLSVNDIQMIYAKAL